MGYTVLRGQRNLIGIVGASGSGKTTLIEKLVPLFKARGLRVSTIKHAHHGFDMDRPGKDSYRHREAGAEEVMVMAGGRWALLREAPQEPTLSELVRRMAYVDLILVEGFKAEDIPKIEVFRPSLGKPAFYPGDGSIGTVATDQPSSVVGRRVLDLNDPRAVCAAILTICPYLPFALAEETRGGI